MKLAVNRYLRSVDEIESTNSRRLISVITALLQPPNHLRFDVGVSQNVVVCPRHAGRVGAEIGSIVLDISRSWRYVAVAK
jgi:hypothetical protein